MIKPIYFPFTYIPEPLAMSFSRFLGRLTVLQPVLHHQPEFLQKLAERALIDVETPYTDDEDRLMAFSRDFNEWGRLHHGEEASLKDIFESGFSAQTFTSQIRSDILKEKESKTAETDPVFLARLFLLMAQNLDLHQNEVDHDLALSLDDELALFTSMTGEQRTLDPARHLSSDEDCGAYMTASRIAAWFRIFKEGKDAPVFLITGSRSVCDEMTDKIDDLQTAAYFEGISVDQPGAIKKEFAECLLRMATTPWNGTEKHQFSDFAVGSGQMFNLQLYILTGTPPSAICTYFSKGITPIKPNDNNQLNTVIGFFEI